MNFEAIKRSKEIYPEPISDISEDGKHEIEILRRGFRIGYNNAMEKYQSKLVYLAMYCPDINESAFTPLSAHRTREGAEKSIAFHKMEKMKEWEKMWTTEEKRKDFAFGEYEDWAIEETIILD